MLNYLDNFNKLKDKKVNYLSELSQDIGTVYKGTLQNIILRNCKTSGTLFFNNDDSTSYDADATYWYITQLGDGIFDGYLESDGRRSAVVTKTADYTVTDQDEVVVCNSTSAFTITLPAATGTGQVFVIKNINTGVITVDGNSSETIDGSTTQTLNQWDGMQIVDYATGTWVII